MTAIEKKKATTELSCYNYCLPTMHAYKLLSEMMLV